MELLFFVIGCLFYSKAMWLQVSSSLSWGLPIFLLAFSLIVFFILLPLLDRIWLPVCVFGVLSVQLIWAALQIWDEQPNLIHLYALVGVSLLSVSVLLWSIHFFKQPFKHSLLYIVLTYYAAHTLIAASVIF